MITKLKSFFYSISIIFLFYIVFIIFTTILNNIRGNNAATILLALSYITILFILIKYINKTFYNISVDDFIGKNHLIALLVAVIFIIPVLITPIFFKIDCEYPILCNKRLAEFSISFIIVAISEELIFRAYFYLVTLKIFKNKIISIVLSSIVFTIIHLFNIDGIIDLIWFFCTSMIITFLYVYTSSLLAAIIFHFLIDIFMKYVTVVPNQVSNYMLIQISTMVISTFIIIALLHKHKKLNDFRFKVE